MISVAHSEELVKLDSIGSVIKKCSAVGRLRATARRLNRCERCPRASSQKSVLRRLNPIFLSRISSDEQESLGCIELSLTIDTIDIIGLSSLTGLSCRLHSRDSADSGSLGIYEDPAGQSVVTSVGRCDARARQLRGMATCLRVE